MYGASLALPGRMSGYRVSSHYVSKPASNSSVLFSGQEVLYGPLGGNHFQLGSEGLVTKSIADRRSKRSKREDQFP